MYRKLILAALLNAALASWCSAATFYVRANATGNNTGSDWNNAWNKTSAINFAALNPGDTVYISGGTYGALNIIKSGAAGKPLLFKRATNSEHGTATGWNTAYDSRVIIDGGGSMAAIGIGEGGTYSSQSYITVDGATRYGIWLRNAMYGVKAGRGDSNNNITLRNLEIGDAGAYKMGEDGVQGQGNNLIVESSFLHDNDDIGTHGDCIQWFNGQGVVVRYNLFKNCGQIMMMGVSSWNSTVSDVEIYYNVFYNRGGTHYNGMTFDRGSPQAGKFVRVYNNTFDLEARSNDGYNNIFNLVAPAGEVSFKNNAVQYSNAGSVSKAGIKASNAYDSSGSYIAFNIPTETGRITSADLGFTDLASSNYRPTASSPLVGSGTPVGLTRDFDGNPVSAKPTIGAFEVAGEKGGVLSPPTNLLIVK